MLQNIGAICANAVGKILLAIIVYFVGKFIIKKLLGLAEKAKGLEKLDPNIRSFTLSAVKWALYVILIVSIIAILGVPMASVVAVLGAAGAAIGGHHAGHFQALQDRRLCGDRRRLRRGEGDQPLLHRAEHPG